MTIYYLMELATEQLIHAKAFTTKALAEKYAAQLGLIYDRLGVLCYDGTQTATIRAINLEVE